MYTFIRKLLWWPYIVTQHIDYTKGSVDCYTEKKVHEPWIQIAAAIYEMQKSENSKN
jgi:hypothetical protein